MIGRTLAFATRAFHNTLLPLHYIIAPFKYISYLNTSYSVYQRPFGVAVDVATLRFPLLKIHHCLFVLNLMLRMGGVRTPAYSSLFAGVIPLRSFKS